MNKNYYGVIMAGGVGSRFWPVSTANFPKQFHDMLGTGQTLLQKTFSRLSQIIPKENILVLTNESYKNLVLGQLPDINEGQVLLEPAMRNTAPCILYASLKIKKQNPDAVMIVAPSDHWIEDEKAFLHNVETCFKASANSDKLLTLGIKPTFPNTGYGYIEFDKTASEEIKKVEQFREKPNYETAKKFLEQGNFLWNAGIFMWSVKTICGAFETYQPALFELFKLGMPVYNTTDEVSFIKENYAKSENISIDYAILEHSKSIYVLPAAFDWNDLGTWGSLYDKLGKDSQNNAIVNAQTLFIGAKNNMVSTQKGKIVVIEGLNDYIVVDKDEVLFICPKEKEQDIKQVREQVKQLFGEKII